MFQGEFDHSVDDKGRVIIPNKIRSTLGDRFYMTKGVGGCIFVYTESGYRQLSETLNAQRQLDPHTMLLQRFFTATELTTDTQGRVAIPNKLREWAKIGDQYAPDDVKKEQRDDVVIIGAGSRIEVWSKASWDVYNAGLTDDMISNSAREVGIA